MTIEQFILRINGLNAEACDELVTTMLESNNEDSDFLTRTAVAAYSLDIINIEQYLSLTAGKI